MWIRTEAIVGPDEKPVQDCRCLSIQWWERSHSHPAWTETWVFSEGEQGHTGTHEDDWDLHLSHHLKPLGGG